MQQQSGLFHEALALWRCEGRNREEGSPEKRQMRLQRGKGKAGVRAWRRPGTEGVARGGWAAGMRDEG